MPLTAFATLNARLRPMDRGERYEDPLLDALDGGVIADIVGGGSQRLPGRKRGRILLHRLRYLRPCSWCSPDYVYS
ncbi:hypothetical protein Q31b_08210 [Novipirellula aureliae]|uniref:Uncharacterized protein n=1 Tax=Novipirellula aureliae TaxID=2527966 RepID=A0A5C6EAU6_9BACT|nr:hypothetical protein Q31b_08210 [Novipirellula aureliae]